ncbi:MAG TPA: hypothetical protein VJT50_10365 [Pyrinomonadaceae bacterium]|nr:hypothetical protein [Pyrinomonadaceae bacterium]
MNFGRVFLGGLLAGLILNIGEFLLNEKILGAQMKSFFTEHGFKDPGSNFIIIAVVMTFILGIVAVWLYALVRPRMGPGPKAAVVAAVVLWFAIYLYSGVINMYLFGIPMSMMMIAFVWGLVEYIIATIAGAWLYREA